MRWDFMRRLVTHNLGWKLFSLAVAIVVWALVANEPDMLSEVRVSVEYKNLPDYLEIDSDLVSNVRLELSGRSGALRQLNDIGAHPVVIVDMAHMRPGTAEVTIGEANVRLPHGVKLVRADPGQIHVKISVKPA
jgi:hypothetical protein